MQQADWEMLLDERCPLCNHNLIERDGWWECSKHADFFRTCNFTISKEKFEKICESINNDNYFADMVGSDPEWYKD